MKLQLERSTIGGSKAHASGSSKLESKSVARPNQEAEGDESGSGKNTQNAAALGVRSSANLKAARTTKSTGKDRHSKVNTARGPRDRRVRLSVSTAIQFYDIQDRLGFDQPSKAIEWLLRKAKPAIDELNQQPVPAAAPSIGKTPLKVDEDSQSAAHDRLQQAQAAVSTSAAEFLHQRGGLWKQESSELNQFRNDATQPRSCGSRVKARERIKERNSGASLRLTTRRDSAADDQLRQDQESSSSAFTNPFPAGVSSTFDSPMRSSFTQLLQSPLPIATSFQSFIQSSSQNLQLLQGLYHHHHHHLHQHPPDPPMTNFNVPASSSRSLQAFQRQQQEQDFMLAQHGGGQQEADYFSDQAHKHHPSTTFTAAAHQWTIQPSQVHHIPYNASRAAAYNSGTAGGEGSYNLFESQRLHHHHDNVQQQLAPLYFVPARIQGLEDDEIDDDHQQEQQQRRLRGGGDE